MMPARETIMTALATLLFASSSFKTTGRKVLLWNETNNQPAIFVRNVRDVVEYHSVMSLTTMHVEVWIYSKTLDGSPPGIGLNNLVDAAIAALAPTGADTRLQRQTLGGLVNSVRVTRVDFDPGDLDSQAKAVIDLEIVVP
ncbi:MAG: hypothetical protein ACREEN_00515 [Stellaceae bacterium]